MKEREPSYSFSEEEACLKSPLAKAFVAKRAAGNAAVNAVDNNLVKRFYNIDHNCYLEGAIPAKYKELIGLSASAVLRCDDCIFYHVIQSYRVGCSRAEVEEALNIALVIGGSIFIPHMRRAYELMAELYG